MDFEITVSTLAYSKIFLHIAKYPYTTCNGLLLAKKNENYKKSSSAAGADDQEQQHVEDLLDTNKQTKRRRFEFVDAIPLFHSSVGLAPSLEVALWQVDSYCSKKGLEIVGYYEANQNNENKTTNQLCYKIAEKLKEQNGESFVFVIDNSKVHPSKKEPFYVIYSLTEQKLKPLDSKLISKSIENDNVYDCCLNLLRENLFNNLIDFDNHLDDISLDWRNTKLDSKIESFNKKR